jgi:hypothetical protein
VDDPGLVLIEDKPSRCQPFGKPRRDLLGLLPGMTAGDQVVGLCGLPDYADCGRACLVSR